MKGAKEGFEGDLGSCIGEWGAARVVGQGRGQAKGINVKKYRPKEVCVKVGFLES